MAKQAKSEAVSPDGLSERSQSVWVAESARSKSAGRQLLLLECLKHLDRADALAAIVASEGAIVTTKTTGAVHLHPLIPVEAKHRSLFVRLAAMLKLEWHYGVDGGRAE